MPVSLTTLTGPIYMPNGATPIGGRVSFELSSWDREEGEALIVSGPTYSNIDENGQFSVELFTTTEGVNTVNYRMYVLWEDSTLSQSYVNDVYVSSPIPHYTKKYIGSFALAGAGPFQVSDLNIISELELNSFDVLLECQAYALAAERDAIDAANALGGLQGYDSRVAAVAATIPASVKWISVLHGGIRCFFQEDASGTALTSNAGARKWSPIAGMPFYLEHWGVSPSATEAGATTDFTTQVRAAVAWTQGDLLVTGYVRITDSIAPNIRCRLHSTVGSLRGGFWVPANFNLSAAGVLVTPDAASGEDASVGDLGFFFDQSAAQASGNRAHLVQYPPAIKIRGARPTFGAIRIHRGYNGIIGDANIGGARFMGELELGCFNINLQLDGPLDFIHADSIQVWPFGFSGSTNLLNIFYDGNTRALKTGLMDGLVIDKIGNFRTAVEFEGGTSILPIVILALQMDGNGSRLIQKSGWTRIACGYSTKSGVQSLPSVIVEGGQLDMTNPHFAGDEQIQLRVTGGVCKLTGGHMWNNNAGGRFAEVTGGYLIIDDLTIRGRTDNARTVSAIRQSGTGVLQLSGLTPVDIGGMVHLVEVTADNAANRVDLSNLRYHTALIPAGATDGIYRLPETSAGPAPKEFQTLPTGASAMAKAQAYLAQNPNQAMGQIFIIDGERLAYTGQQGPYAALPGFVPRAQNDTQTSGPSGESTTNYGANVGDAHTEETRRARGSTNATAAAANAGDAIKYENMTAHNGTTYQVVEQTRVGVLAKAGALLSGVRDWFISDAAGALQQVLRMTSALVRFYTPVQIDGAITGNAVTQSQMDATAGRLTKVGDFGLGGSSISVTNLNTISVNGIYRIGDSDAVAGNAPTVGSWTVIHMQFDGSAAYQEAHLAGQATFVVYRRVRPSTAIGWGPWYRVLSGRDLVGPVAQSGGIPTQSAIERGSNANGHFTKFADGTMMCHHQLNTAAGSAVTWTYPAEFVNGSTPRVQLTPVAITPVYAAHGGANYQNTTLRAWNGSGTQVLAGVDVVAHGRWF